jgi:hypothetical protein
MTSQDLPKEAEKKFCAGGNLSALSWTHTMDNHEIQANTHSLNLTKSDYESGFLSRAFEILDIEPTITVTNGEISRISVTGRKNLETLSRYGCEFPGSKVYTGRATEAPARGR